MMLHKSFHSCRGLIGQASHDHLVYSSPGLLKNSDVSATTQPPTSVKVNVNLDPNPSPMKVAVYPPKRTNLCENLGPM